MASIFYFSSRRNPLSFLPSRGQRESIDKVAHFAEYAGLLFLLHHALREHGSRRAGEPREKGNKRKREFVNNNPSSTVVSGQSSVVALVLALVYAISDELHQELTPGRSFELADIGYDVAGMVTALGFIWTHRHLKPRRNPVQKTNLSRDERFILALHDVVLSSFREQFGDASIVGVSLTPFAHECWITVRVTEKTPSMVDLAQELETELREDAGKYVNILVEQPWRTTVTDLLRKTLTLGR